MAAAARNISLDEIRKVIAQTNSNSPVGTLYGPRQNVTLSATAAMRTADEYRRSSLPGATARRCGCEEVARCHRARREQPAGDLVQRKPRHHARHATAAGLECCGGGRRGEGALAGLPRATAAVDQPRGPHRPLDLGTGVRSPTCRITLLIAIALVVLVIFLFLRSASATIIPSLAIPVSLIGTCAAMYAFGFSINNMTLLALTLSVGFVVDDAIVMLENIVRHVENGMRPFEAALKGAQEIGFTIISITFSLVAVFIPVLLMGGMVGRIFREFAVTISVAIIISGFVSLTLTPMLCARVLRHHRGQKQNFVLRAFEAMFTGWLRGYEWSLDKVIKYKSVMLAGHFRHAVRHGLALHLYSEGLLPERRYRLHLRDYRGAAESRSRRCRRCNARSRRSSARTRRSNT